MFAKSAEWFRLTYYRLGCRFEAMSKTLFEKIIDREIPATVVYEDDLVLAFRDVKAQAPTHVLIIPKKSIPRIAEAKPEDHKVLGHLLLKAGEIANQLGLTQSGFRLVINNGPDAGESVPHLHCHIIGGRKMAWPPG
jgi:histidine triad (HIT) family protein